MLTQSIETDSTSPRNQSPEDLFNLHLITTYPNIRDEFCHLLKTGQFPHSYPSQACRLAQKFDANATDKLKKVYSQINLESNDFHFFIGFANEIINDNIDAQKLIELYAEYNDLKLSAQKERDYYTSCLQQDSSDIVWGHDMLLSTPSLMKYAPGLVPLIFNESVYNVRQENLALQLKPTAKFAEITKNEILTNLFHSFRTRVNLEKLLADLLQSKNNDFSQMLTLTPEDLYKVAGLEPEVMPQPVYEQVSAIVASVRDQINAGLQPFRILRKGLDNYRDLSHSPLRPLEDLITLFVQQLHLSGNAQKIINDFFQELNNQKVPYPGITIGIGCSSLESSTKCLHDVERTILFAEAIGDAVEKKLQQKEGIIEILDVGTGGYGILSVFAALKAKSLNQENRIRITALDLNKSSLINAKFVIESLGLGDMINLIYTDALVYAHDKPIDVFISETMDAGLFHNESLAQIVTGFSNQRASDAIMIPASVELNLAFIDKDSYINAQLMPNHFSSTDQPVYKDARNSHLFTLDHRGLLQLFVEGKIDTNGLSPGVYVPGIKTTVNFHNGSKLEDTGSPLNRFLEIKFSTPVTVTPTQNYEISIKYEPGSEIVQKYIRPI